MKRFIKDSLILTSGLIVCLSTPRMGYSQGSNVAFVSQINHGANSVYLKQLPRSARIADPKTTRPTNPEPSHAGQQVEERDIKTQIFDFGQMTESLGFILPSVRQGIISVLAQQR